MADETSEWAHAHNEEGEHERKDDATEDHHQSMEFDTETDTFHHQAELDEIIDGAYTVEMEGMQELQRTFSNVITEFEGDSSVERILSEYKKLYEALRSSHTIQKKIIMENSGLRCEIKNNADKVHLAMHLAQEDKEIIRNLTKQANQAWNEAELVSDKEARARGVILKLQDEISNLTALVEDGSGVQELHTVAHLAVSERKELEESLVQMKADLEFKDMKMQELNERLMVKDESCKREATVMSINLKASEKKYTELQKKVQEMEEYTRMLERVRANLTLENTNGATELEGVKTRMNKMEKDEGDLKAEIAKTTQHSNDQWDMITEKTKELSKLHGDVDVLKKRVSNLQHANNYLKEKMDEKDVNAKACERRLKKRDAEVDAMEKKFESTSQTIKNLQYSAQQKEEKLQLEKDNVDGLSRTLHDVQTSLKKIQVDADEYKRSAHFAKQQSVNLAVDKATLEKTVLLKDKTNVSMIKELNIMTHQLNKAIDQVAVMESDKERLYGRINTVLEMVNSLAVDNENKEAKLLMLLKVNNEQEAHINLINTKLFRMTNQRDNISNELHLIQLKNDELSLANHNFSKQSSSLAEDLHNKESELDKMVATNSVLRNDIRSLEIDIVQWQEENNKKKVKIDDLELMTRNMDIALCQKEKEIGKLRLVLDQMVNQRNLLGYQCLKKKEQIHLLTEKNALLQHIFRSGNKAFNNQTRHVDELHVHVKNLQRQKRFLLNRIETIDNYKSKLGLANQQLVGALARSLAMEGEHPFNLHRWRHLKAVDISQYEMIIKVQYLLKRCIMKTDEVTRLESVILEKTAVVTEMRHILERRPGMAFVQKAKADEKAKEELDKKLKAATAERNMSAAKLESQAVKTRNLIDRLTEERKKRVEMNKKNIKLMNKVSKLPPIAHRTHTLNVVEKK